MRIFLTGIFFLLNFIEINAQSFSDFSKTFAFNVKSPDDFFERFNFKKNTGFQSYLQRNYPGVIIYRKDLIRMLINQQNNDLLQERKKDVTAFIAEVTDTNNPQFIKYSNNNWFAELTCKVIHKGKPKKLTLILKVDQSEQNTFCWSLVSAKADFLKLHGTKADSILLLSDNKPVSVKKYSAKYFLSPVSHSLDFMNADNIFINKTHINEYIYNGYRSFELKKFISLLQKSEIIFVQVNKIRYHFLQLQGWVVVVDYFNRYNVNSGWLINGLIKISEEEKAKYKASHLNILQELN